MSRAGNLSSAAYFRAQGWGVGDILRGEPIYHKGKQIESARFVVITAIGEANVLCKTQFIGEFNWSAESTYEFNARDWSLAISERATPEEIA